MTFSAKSSEPRAFTALKRPLSEQQRTMIEFIGGFTDEYYIGNETFAIRGEFDRARLRRAIAKIMERHEMARSVFPDDQCYEVLPYKLALTDNVINECPERFGSAEAAAAAGEKWANRPMELNREIPLRVWHGIISERESVLVIAGHHLVFDGWSLKNLYMELEKAYADSNSLSPASQYYEALTSHGPEALRVPPDLFQRNYEGIRALQGAVQSPLGPASVLFVERPAEHATRLREACGLLPTTPYAVAVSAFLAALGDLVGDSEVIVGTASAGRASGAAARALGYFSNTIFMGTAGGTPEKILEDVRILLTKWQTSPRVQWESVLKHYNATGLYPVKFAFERAEMASPDARFPGVEVIRVANKHNGGVARRVADIAGSYGVDGITYRARYRSDAVDEKWVSTLLNKCLDIQDELCRATLSRSE